MIEKTDWEWLISTALAVIQIWLAIKKPPKRSDRRKEKRKRRR